MTWAAAVGAASDITGGIIGYNAAKRNQIRSEDFQKEMAQNGLRWRVEDAKAAGIHPLAALGAQLPSGNPISVGDAGLGESISRAGQNISRSMASTQTADERAETQLRLELLRSQVSETDARAGYYNSQSMRLSEPQIGPPMPGQVKPVAPDQYSRSKEDSSRVASNNPVWQSTEVAPGVFMDLPYSQGESPFESMEGVVPQALTLWKNFWYNPKKKYANERRELGEKMMPMYWQILNRFRVKERR